jgi:hypothetical protein
VIVIYTIAGYKKWGICLKKQGRFCNKQERFFHIAVKDRFSGSKASPFNKSGESKYNRP